MIVHRNRFDPSVTRVTRSTIVSKDRERKVKLISRQVVLGAMLRRQKAAASGPFKREITYSDGRSKRPRRYRLPLVLHAIPFYRSIAEIQARARASKHRGPYPRSTPTTIARAIIAIPRSLELAQRETSAFVLVGRAN